MTSRTKKPNISPIPETPDLKSNFDLHKEYDDYLREEAKRNNHIKEKKIAKSKIQEGVNNINFYNEKLRMINEQNVYDPKEIDLKIKDLKLLEKEIKEEIILQEKIKKKYIDEIFVNGESLIAEIEEKRLKESAKKEKSILKKLIDFLFGF